MDAKQTQANAANPPVKTRREENFIPMSLPQQKLAVPELPGYHLHWMMGKPQRIQQALRAGYEFVEQGEVDTVSNDLASCPELGGSTDLGNRVSYIAGAISEQGQPVRLYLMKLRKELRDKYNRMQEEENDKLVGALRGGNTGNVGGRDISNRYGQERNRNIFSKRA